MAMRYPVTGPASTIACPRHGCAVALSAEGYIITSCPACVRVAQKAEDKLNAEIDRRKAEAESWSASA